MDLGLNNKNVLITGGTKGIGKAIAEVFSNNGSNVIITGRKSEDLILSCDEIFNLTNTQVKGIVVDLYDKGACEYLFKEAMDQLGSIDILINNAGVWPTSYIKDMQEEDFEKTLYLNLEVPFILSKLFTNYRIDNSIRGKIININSQAAFNGSTTGHAHYAASKGGLVAFMISLAREVAQYGINVNSIAPGLVRTPMLEENYLKNKEYYDNRVPIGRIAEPMDIAKIALFLGSNLSDYMTGTTIDATGGMLMR